MANKEACEVYIEQQIKEGIEAGKKPWAIAKEISEWVQKFFEVWINPQTIKSRAIRMRGKVCSNEQKKSQPIENTEYSKPEIIEDRKPQGGGAREGAGRPRITETYPVSDAQSFASIAISQLERINKNDPERSAALNRVYEWVRKEIENGKNL